MMSCRTAVLLLLVLVALFGTQADAKKKHVKKQKPKPHSRPAPRPPPPAAAAAQPEVAAVTAEAAAAPSAQSVENQQAAAAFVEKVEAQKVQLQQIAQQSSEENKRLVDGHNKLVNEYNVLLGRHSDLIKKFNLLVEEVQDPSTATFLAAKAFKIYKHPGIQGAVNKTHIHVLPAAHGFLKDSAQKGSVWFNRSQTEVQHFLQSLGGQSSEEWAPTASGFIVYGCVLLPLAMACWCVLEFVCRLRTLVLFGHVYMAFAFSMLAVFAATTGDDPLTTFAEQDSKLYQFTQACFALVFVLYGFVSFVALCCSNSKDVSFKCLQMVLLAVFAAVYYTLVWTPAMVDELPKVDDFVDSLFPTAPATPPAEAEQTPMITTSPYLVVAGVFLFLFLLDRGEEKAVAVAEEEEKEK